MPEIQMPKLSDTMTEGTLVSWKKKVGDEVTAGEVLAEIETDKATMEWESTEDGVLKEIKFETGATVTSFGLPSVNVPVLSTTSVVIFSRSVARPIGVGAYALPE